MYYSFLALFFVSGFCSLVYEIVWLRLAMGAFGVTAPFVSIFLSVFMAGLGLGSWAAGRLSRKMESRTASGTMALYALCELLLAASSVAVPFLLSAGRQALAGSFGAVEWGSFGYYLASGLCTVLCLLPWCFLMGATIPLAMATLEKRFTGQARNSFSFLYLANVLGASVGVFCSAFVLIELFGFRGTLIIAGLLNAAIAAFAYLISRSGSMAQSRGRLVEVSAAPHGGARELSLVFMTGFVCMAMEVVWTRQFTPYLGTTIYAFAAILISYLLASFGGTWFYRYRLQSGAVPDDLAWIVSGALCLPPLMTADPYIALNGPLRVALGLVPICGLTGFLTPLLIDRFSRGDPDRAGRAYAVNALGCLAGPLFAGFLLLPRMPEKYALALLSAPFFTVGLAATVRGTPGRARSWGRLAVYATLAAFGLAGISRTRIYEDQWTASGKRAEVRRDYQAGVVAGGEGKDAYLLVNGIGMTKLTPITKMMAHLPLAFLSIPPRNALVICFGMGTTFRSLLSWGIPSTVVELVPSVPEVFGRFHSDAAKVLASPSARVVIDNGRRFLARSREQFDVITIDAAPPMEAAGTSALFTTEFYALCKERLKPDGILQQWIMEPMEPVVMSFFAKALKESFPYVRVFRSVEGWGYHCLASRKPIPDVSASSLAARLPPAARKDLLEYGPYSDAARQFLAMLDNEVHLDWLVIWPDARPLRDDRPINEYYFLRREFPDPWTRQGRLYGPL